MTQGDDGPNHEGRSRIELRRQVVLFGPNAADVRLADELRAADLRRVAIVASRSVAAAGLLEQMKRGALAGVSIVDEVIGVAPGAPLSGVLAMADRFLATDLDAIVAIGGGSVIDSSKATALAIAKPGGLDAYFSSAPSPAHVPELPIAIIAIPTTLSGAEVTASAGVTNEAGVKHVIRGRPLAPRIVASDPAYFRPSPPELLGNTAMMALAHCLESLYAPDPNPLSVATALYGAELIARGYRGTPTESTTSVDFANLAAGSVLAGLAISNSRSGIQHALCHVLGAGEFGMTQAQAHAVMLPTVMRFNDPVTEPWQRRLALSMSLDGATEPASGIEAFRRRAMASSALRAFSLSPSDFRRIAKHTATEPGARANPRPVGPSDVEAMLEAAW